MLRINPLVFNAVLVITLLVESQTIGAEPTKGLEANANFSVLAESPEVAEEILQVADSYRTEIALRWLGRELPDGFGGVSMTVWFDGEDRSRTWLLDETSKRTKHTMWIHTSPEKIHSALAHEITHVVLANRYPQLPAFAHEGAASECDDESRHAIRRKVLAWFVETDRWPELRKLMNASEIQPDDHTAYAAATSLTAYLLTLADRRTFLEFAQFGAAKSDWDTALSDYYGISSVKKLQQAWKRWVFQHGIKGSN